MQRRWDMAPPAIPDLAARRLERERMDDPELDALEHVQALAGLRRLNIASGTARTLWRRIRPLAPEDSSTSIRILDVATGSGDVPIALKRLANRRRLAVEVDGCDISARSVDMARRHAQRFGLDMGFMQLDAIQDSIPGGYDVVTCSLFMHHLCQEHAIALLSKLADAARRMVLVSDLRRCHSGYLLACAASRALSRSRIVHVDALLSVRAAYTIPEFESLVQAAGLHGARTSPCWPRRFLMEWRRR